MSKIVVVGRQPHPGIRLLGELRMATELPLGQIRAALTDGTPLVERQLFGNDHGDSAFVLRAVGKCLVDEGVTVDVFELEPDEAFETAILDRCRIDLVIMDRILSQFEGLLLPT